MLIVSELKCTKEINSGITGLGTLHNRVNGGYFNKYRKLGALNAYSTEDFTLGLYNTETDTIEYTKLVDFLHKIIDMSNEDINSRYYGVICKSRQLESFSIRILSKKEYQQLLRLKLLGMVNDKSVLVSSKGCIKDGVFTIPNGVLEFNSYKVDLYESVHTVICPDSLITLELQSEKIIEHLSYIEVDTLDSIRGTDSIFTDKDMLTIKCRRSCIVTDSFVKNLAVRTRHSIDTQHGTAKVVTPRIIVEYNCKNREIKRRLLSC